MWHTLLPLAYKTLTYIPLQQRDYIMCSACYNVLVHFPALPFKQWVKFPLFLSHSWRAVVPSDEDE
jgi:hypothetical protein